MLIIGREVKAFLRNYLLGPPILIGGKLVEPIGSRLFKPATTLKEDDLGKRHKNRKGNMPEGNANNTQTQPRTGYGASGYDENSGS